MKNKHVEYKRIVNGAKVAVLCIHGILGTPNHFRDLIPLIPEDYSVYAMVTAGHCSEVRDFSKSSLKMWEESVQKAIDELLLTHEEVYIVGHSMGTLFAIDQALKEPRVKRLFCISIPIKVGFKLRMIPMALKIYTKRIKENDIITLTVRECYGCTDSRNIFLYLGWIPRFLDLFKKIRDIRGKLSKLQTPCTAYQSVLDELVSPKSIQMLKNESGIRVVALEKSTHFYYEDGELEFLKREFIKFLS